MSTVESIATSPEEWLKLEEELRQMQRDSAAGKFEKQEGETTDLWEARLAKLMKRGVEITSILRRTNTGPAAPKKARGSRNKDVDIAKLSDDLLG